MQAFAHEEMVMVGMRLTKLDCIRRSFLAFMATNAGAGAARQLQSARTATAVWKVCPSAHRHRCSADLSRSTLFNPMAYGSEFGERLLSTRKGRLEFL